MDTVEAMEASGATKVNISRSESYAATTTTDIGFDELMNDLKNADKTGRQWGLNRCRLQNGKTVFLCNEHMQQAIVDGELLEHMK